MKWVIISHVLHKRAGQKYFGYAPYVREMNLWLKNAEEVWILAPLQEGEPNSIQVAYQHSQLHFIPLPALQFTSFTTSFFSFLRLPEILLKMSRYFKKADHLHLRCPGNMGLLGTIFQIFFPQKPKTVKYAGNWDPNSHQPWTYRLQKKLLSNTFLSRNIKVLVYGKWQRQTANIVPFFTASFSEKDKMSLPKNFTGNLRFVFVGSLVKGKRPLLAVKIVQALKNKGYKVQLEMYGEGILREELEIFIKENNLENYIQLHGNQHLNVVKQALKIANFVLLPSQSEGWPKALAEGMFFACLPVATPVSCVPWMLAQGKRGILIKANTAAAVAHLEKELKHPEKLAQMSQEALAWSQQYTLEKFEREIQTLI